MAKKKNAEAEPNGQQEAAATAEPQPAPNGSGTVVQTFTYPVSKDTHVQAVVIEKVIPLRDQTTFIAHEVRLQKLWVNDKGEEKTLYGFRPSELYACAHAIQAAERYILELRRVETPF